MPDHGSCQTTEHRIREVQPVLYLRILYIVLSSWALTVFFGNIFLLIFWLSYGFLVQNLFVELLAKLEIIWNLARENLEQGIPQLYYAPSCMFSAMHMYLSVMHFWLMIVKSPFYESQKCYGALPEFHIIFFAWYISKTGKNSFFVGKKLFWNVILLV